MINRFEILWEGNFYIIIGWCHHVGQYLNIDNKHNNERK